MFAYLKVFITLIGVFSASRIRKDEVECLRSLQGRYSMIQCSFVEVFKLIESVKEFDQHQEDCQIFDPDEYIFLLSLEKIQPKLNAQIDSLTDSIAETIRYFRSRNDLSLDLFALSKKCLRALENTLVQIDDGMELLKGASGSDTHRECTEFHDHIKLKLRLLKIYYDEALKD